MKTSKVVTLNFKKEQILEQLPKTIDLMISYFIPSIDNFGIRAVKYKITDQMPGAGLEAQEGTYYHSSDMYNSQHLWMPVIQGSQMFPLAWSFKYIVPKNYTVIASGQLYIKQVESGDTQRTMFHYKLSSQADLAPPTKIGFIFGKFGEVYKMKDVKSIQNAYGFFINSDKQALFTANNHFIEKSIVDTVLYHLQSRIIG